MIDAAASDPLDLARRAASGQFDDAVLSWLQRGMAACLNADPTSPLQLERCLRLPRSRVKWKKARRDFWIFQAARAIGGNATTWTLALKVSAELQAFRARGPWRTWCTRQEAPAGATSLHAALFYVCRFSDGFECIGEHQVYRVLQKESPAFLGMEMPELLRCNAGSGSTQYGENAT